MPDISTLVSDIESLFTNGATLTEHALKTFSQEVGVNLGQRFAEYSQVRVPYLRLSNVGKPLRQLWFEIKSGFPPEPLSPATKMKFLYGDVLEDLLILLAIEAGHEVSDLQKKVEVDGVPGSIDCLIDGVLVDVKSASTYSFNKFRTSTLRENDPFGYIGQLAGYSCALGGISGAFLVVDKTLGHLCLDRYSKEELAEYDVRKRIAKASQVLREEKPPDELCYTPEPEGKSGNLKLPVGCSYCGHKWNCYEQQGVKLRTFYYSNGPVYLTHVAKEPRVQEVI